MSDDTLQLRDLAPAQELIPGSIWPWWQWVLIILTILSALAFLAVFLRQRKKINPPPLPNLELNAYKEALQALASVTADSAREAAIQASLIFRRYLSQAAGDPSLFETTEEFTHRPATLNEIPASLRPQVINHLLTLSDIKYIPSPGDGGASFFQSTRELIETLHQHHLAA